MENALDWKLYILLCGDGSYYTGITRDVEKRLRSHRTGRGAKYTRGRGPLTLCYTEPCGSHSQALRRELEVKALTRKEKEALIAGRELANMKSVQSKKPIVGVVPLWDEGRQSLWMLPGYLEGIRHAGGIPLVLPLTEDEEDIRRLCSLCGGFLFTGGQDVAPKLYGEQPKQTLGELCPSRDKMEPLLLRQALGEHKPVFGICRGIQLMNTVLGGTLYQDLPTEAPSPVVHHQDAPYNAPAHTVEVLEGTPLAGLLGAGTLPVNSCHHQGLRQLAPTLSPMAVAPDGIVEAVYQPEQPFCWAVQWHPEFFGVGNPVSDALFRAFVEAITAVTPPADGASPEAAPLGQSEQG